VIVESAAYMVASSIGLDTGPYSGAYVEIWNQRDRSGVGEGLFDEHGRHGDDEASELDALRRFAERTDELANTIELAIAEDEAAEADAESGLGRRD
jgi:hypothetical protein